MKLIYNITNDVFKAMAVLFVLFSTSAAVMLSCENSSPAGNSEPDEFDDLRVKRIYQETSGYPSNVTIYEIDGVEYLVNYHGGICPLVINEKTDTL